ncbi:MAG: hypothetical protein V2A67_04345 [Bacteroidota bacterium]
MKKLIIISIVLFCGCSEDFIPYVIDSKPIPVVYGLIDVDDSVHYIKLTKTFVGSDDAYQLAKDTTNVLYDSVNLEIICLDGNQNVVKKLAFTKTYATPSTPVLFTPQREWYYASTEKFPSRDSFEYFRLEASLYNENDTLNSYLFHYLDPVRIYAPNRKVRYFSVYNETITTIESTGFSQCGSSLRFRYSENINGKNSDRTFVKFLFDNTGIIPITPQKFYSIIRNGIKDNPEVGYRTFISLDIFSYTAGAEFINYIKTYNSDSDPYEALSNIFNNGIGMLATYTKDSITNLKLDQKTLDSLADGQYTKALKFVRYQ